MIETRRLKNVVIFIQTILSFVLSRKIVINFPRNYKQVCDVSQQSQSEEEFIEFLDLCRGQEGTRNAFIRDARTALEKNILPKTQSL